jgi:phospholipase D1/2
MPGRPILQPGGTCWRIERASRAALVVDAAGYFRAVKAAMLRARHAIILIGWDFDTRIMLEREPAHPKAPNSLGGLLSWIAETKPHLSIHILRWDLGVVKVLGRGTTVFTVARWLWRGRIHIGLDGAHPTGSAHHHKIVVIDDALAFCGGIDMTADRWDTREHLDDEPWRRRPTTRRRYGPWHDATMAVDGAAARALGEHARECWRLARGERLDPPPAGSDPWPDDLRPTFREVEVAIARTAPAHGERPETREIEALYRAAIGAAERFVYMESQYFASRAVAEAIATRLSQAEGPEFVVVNPSNAEGWLEEAAMGSARARLLAMLGHADRFGRLRIYTPVTAGGQPIYVHAKIMIVDQRLIRVGSSNLNNRSMGYDTECDLAIEAAEAERAGPVAATIASCRDDLLGEHLGVEPRRVSAVLARTGSLIATVEELRGGTGRTLRPFQPPPVSGPERFLADHELLDPERPRAFYDVLTKSPFLHRLRHLRAR